MDSITRREEYYYIYAKVAEIPGHI